MLFFDLIMVELFVSMIIKIKITSRKNINLNLKPSKIKKWYNFYKNNINLAKCHFSVIQVYKKYLSLIL